MHLHLSMLSPRGGGTPVGPKNLVKSDQISPPWEAISLKFIVVVVHILQIINVNCQAFLLTPLMLCVIRGK